MSTFILYPSVTIDPTLPPETLSAVRAVGLARVLDLIAGQEQTAPRSGRGRPRVVLERSWFIVARDDLDSEARPLHTRLTTAANALLVRHGLGPTQQDALVRWHWDQLCALRAQSRLRAALSSASGPEAREAAQELGHAVERTTASIAGLEARLADAGRSAPVVETLAESQGSPAAQSSTLREARLALFQADQYGQTDPEADFLRT
jgi:hypothetical protein